jgi:hypothetical protein
MFCPAFKARSRGPNSKIVPGRTASYITPMTTIDAANDIIQRLEILDEGIANGRAYRQLLEALHADQNLRGDAVTAATMVRAAVLRSALGCVMAALDPPDNRDNRASIGQILVALRDQEVEAELIRPAFKGAVQAGTFATLQTAYNAVRASDSYRRCRDLRNRAVSHFLLGQSVEPAQYADVYTTQDAAEELTGDLFKFCGGRRVRFPENAVRTGELAELFWRLYRQGAAGV